MKVFVAGPVDFWWNQNWESQQHVEYMKWREWVTTALIEAGHLVYRPDRAWKGAWKEEAQLVNDVAIQVCEALVYLTPHRIPAHGTDEEIKYAQGLDIPTYHAPPMDISQIAEFIIPLDDPYGDVHRKAYT